MEWMDGMDGMDGWMNGWMDGWMDGILNRTVVLSYDCCVVHFCSTVIVVRDMFYHDDGNITVSIECIIPLHATISFCRINGLSFNDISLLSPALLPSLLPRPI